MYPNEEGQDEWGTQQGRKSGGERSQELDLEYCEGNAADKATLIDYSKTGANKR